VHVLRAKVEYLLYTKKCWVVWDKNGQTQPLGLKMLNQLLGLSIFDPYHIG